MIRASEERTNRREEGGGCLEGKESRQNRGGKENEGRKEAVWRIIGEKRRKSRRGEEQREFNIFLNRPLYCRSYWKNNF